jgi:pimeloyl-ACP methyl ester carboxylesterase
MDLFFCHGLESTPHGRKYQALVAAGARPIAPDFRGMNLAQRVDTLRPLLETCPGALIVGSSYGGITALCASIQIVDGGGTVGGLLLLAPALGRREPPADRMALRVVAPTTIIHGTRDEVVPIAISRNFVSANPSARLFEVDDEHRLTDSLPLIVDVTMAMVATLAAEQT